VARYPNRRNPRPPTKLRRPSCFPLQLLKERTQKGKNRYDRRQDDDEVIVERDHRPVAVIKMPGPGRKLSECIALAKAHEKELGYAPVPDPDFAKDVQAAIDSRREPFHSSRQHGISPRLRRADRRRA
jgi:hypothetical protein